MEYKNKLTIQSIQADSEAERVGLKKGDIILKYNGNKNERDLSYLKNLISNTLGLHQVVIKVE